VRSVLYRFPDLAQFEQMIAGVGDSELELGLPSGEAVEDGEWVLAIFELGRGRRATSCAARAAVSPDGGRLLFEPRDWTRLADFAQKQALNPSAPSRLSSNPGPQERGALPDPRQERALPPDARQERGLLSDPRGSSAPPPGMRAGGSTAPPPSPVEVREAALRRESGRPPGEPARVLVVDDDPDIREVVTAMLEAVGLRVMQSESAEDALSRVQNDVVDLLVLDWNLPRMTGLELCRIIRRQPGLSHVPVLFLTANASSQDMVDAFASGADDYVVKPFRAPELGARIFSLLRRGRLLLGG
jgi:two-component system, OmpR family, phosphate regulon response regulator PhoB